MVKILPANARDTRDAGWIPGFRRRPGIEMTTYSSILAEKSHRQRSLVGYSLWFAKSQTWLSMCAYTEYQWLAYSFSQKSSKDKCSSLILFEVNRKSHIKTWWRNKTRVPTPTTTIQHSFESFGHSNQSRKRTKRNPDRKRCETLTVCRWHDPLHRKL